MSNSQQYLDLYQFTPEENRRFACSNFTKLVHTNARFEGVNTTLPHPQTIMDGMSVAGVVVEDVLTIVNLKRGWQCVQKSAYIHNIRHYLPTQQFQTSS